MVVVVNKVYEHVGIYQKFIVSIQSLFSRCTRSDLVRQLRDFDDASRTLKQMIRVCITA